MNVYSLDLRRKVIAYLEAGHTYRETAQHFSINVKSVLRWKKQM